MNWCSVFCQKGRISLSPLATQPHDDVPKSRYAFQPLLWDVSCHNSHQGELTNSLAHIFTQQKWDNLPFASLHSGEQTTTAQRERRRSEQPPPTDGVDCLERKFTTAQNLPLASQPAEKSRSTKGQTAQGGGCSRLLAALRSVNFQQPSRRHMLLGERRASCVL